MFFYKAIVDCIREEKHTFLDLGCSAMWCGYYDGNEKSKRCQDKVNFMEVKNCEKSTTGN